MSRCEDYPCCGHTSEDPCPRLDRNGKIVPECVTCGARLRGKYRSGSFCGGCLRRQRFADREAYGDDY